MITKIDQKDIARAQFSRFTDELKNALRISADRNKWDAETWTLQVKMIARSIECKDATAEEIAAAYRVSPP